MKIRTRILLAAGCIGLLAIGYLAHSYRDEFRQKIQWVAEQIHASPYGPYICIGLSIVTSIPPLLGFTFTVTLTGFVYGFPGGIFPAVIGGFTGAMLCFALIRHFNFARFIRFSSSKQDKYRAIQEAIQQGGIGMLLLIRLSPIPWPITNMILSMTPGLPTSHFVLATLISSGKLSLEVWVGSQLANLSDPSLPPSAHRVTLYTMGCGLLLLAIVAFWLYRLTMQKVSQPSSDVEKYTGPDDLDVLTPVQEQRNMTLSLDLSSKITA